MTFFFSALTEFYMDDLQALGNAQLKYQDLSRKYQALKLEHSKTTRTKKGRKSDLGGEDREIGHAGAKFSLIGDPWINPTTLTLNRLTSMDTLNPARYDNPRAEEYAILAEVYDSLPEHLQQALSDKKRQASFITTVSPFLSIIYVLIQAPIIVSR